MTDQTPLDSAHAAMLAALEDDAARLAFYGMLADTDLFIRLEDEATPDSISPEILELEGARYALVFDREERLADFSGQPTSYAALPGRIIANMLAGKNIGLGLNLGVAPSSILIPAEAMDWLQNALSASPELSQTQINAILPAAPGCQPLVDALRQKLAFAGGLVQAAYLASVQLQDGRKNALLGLIGAPPEAHQALARTAQEALVFSGLESQTLDVVFPDPGSSLARKLENIGLGINLPPPAPAESEKIKEIRPVAPGSDPDKPPILR